jgi:hypothetical protein
MRKPQKDISGCRFNKLTALEYKGNQKWLCKCDCGNLTTVKGSMLRNNHTTSCGCNKRNDLTGMRYGKLTVVRYVESRSMGQAKKIKIPYWLCKCDCGGESIISSTSLQANLRCSCGCMSSKHLKGLCSKNFKGHGLIHGSIFSNIKTKAARRGLECTITVKYISELFEKQKRKCALSGLDLYISEVSKETTRSWGSTASLDRIDSSKGYVEGNVQWVHKDINQMKWSFPEVYLIEICKRIFLKSLSEGGTNAKLCDENIYRFSPKVFGNRRTRRKDISVD